MQRESRSARKNSLVDRYLLALPLRSLSPIDPSPFSYSSPFLSPPLPPLPAHKSQSAKILHSASPTPPHSFAYHHKKSFYLPLLYSPPSSPLTNKIPINNMRVTQYDATFWANAEQARNTAVSAHKADLSSRQNHIRRCQLSIEHQVGNTHLYNCLISRDNKSLSTISTHVSLLSRDNLSLSTICWNRSECWRWRWVCLYWLWRSPSRVPFSSMKTVSSSINLDIFSTHFVLYQYIFSINELIYFEKSRWKISLPIDM